MAARSLYISFLFGKRFNCLLLLLIYTYVSVFVYMFSCDGCQKPKSQMNIVLCGTKRHMCFSRGFSVFTFLCANWPYSHTDQCPLWSTRSPHIWISNYPIHMQVFREAINRIYIYVYKHGKTLCSVLDPTIINSLKWPAQEYIQNKLFKHFYRKYRFVYDIYSVLFLHAYMFQVHMWFLAVIV